MIDLEKELLDKIAGGNAVLFTGAGFSVDTENIIGEHPPMANELAEKICKIANIQSASGRLDYVAGRCIKAKYTAMLIKKLREWYTLKQASDDTNKILSVKWRRLYTTNYDMSFELGLVSNQKSYKTICTDEDFSQNAKGENLCIHINGMIEALDENTLEKDFRLSDSSYVASALDKVTSMKWKSFFKKDLENCSALVFIGYSLYDFEVEKLLFENKDFKNKTYFICCNDIFDSKNDELKYRLENYGKILGIEKKGISNLIANNKDVFSESKIILTDFIKYDDTFRLDESEIKDKTAKDALAFGSQADKLAVCSVYNSRSAINPLYFVYRKESVETIIEKLNTGSHVFISAECGNGKTCLLYQVAAKLSSMSNSVFFLSNGYRGDRDQLDYIYHLPGIKYIIVDNSFSNENFLRTFFEAQYDDIILLCADRTVRQNMLISSFDAENLLQDNVVLLQDFNLFSKDESKAFVFLIDALGLWGEFSGRGYDEKIKCLNGDTDRIQLAPALLKLLEAKQIKERISDLLFKLVSKNNSYRKTIFVLCYMSIIGIPLVDSFVSDVANSDEIFKSNFVLTTEFKQLFLKSRESYTIPFSFALYVLKESGVFNGYDISDYLLDIVSRLGSKTGRADILHGVVLDSLRFHCIESIIPEKEKKAVMQDYYEKLKTTDVFGHRLMHDPHYWMQYAMTKMMCYDYETAQEYLNTAYGKASRLSGDTVTGKYNTNKLDNQQAHLYLLMAQDKMILDSGKIYELFDKADVRLRYATIDRFLMHRVNDMLDVFKAKMTKLSNKHKSSIQNTIKQYIEKLQKSVSSGICQDITPAILLQTHNSFEYLMNYTSGEKK